MSCDISDGCLPRHLNGLFPLLSGLVKGFTVQKSICQWWGRFCWQQLLAAVSGGFTKPELGASPDRGIPGPAVSGLVFAPLGPSDREDCALAERRGADHVRGDDVMTRTAFYFDEKCLWHSVKPHALIFPIGGWVQPPAASAYAESPDSKRRLKSLMDVSGLTRKLNERSAFPAEREVLLRVHPASYLDRFAELSAGEGGDIGIEASFGPGGYDIARRRS
jgi:hypothetical protein